MVVMPCGLNGQLKINIANSGGSIADGEIMWMLWCQIEKIIPAFEAQSESWRGGTQVPFPRGHDVSHCPLIAAERQFQ